MQCPKCSIDMTVDYGGIECKNDDTPDLQTEVYSLQSLLCRNPQCQNYNRVVEIVRTNLT